MSDLAYLSATEAVAGFTARELSPIELLDAVITRAAETEPHVNAICETLHEDAYEAARTAERHYADGTARLLEGIPVALKEEHPIAGRTHEQGSLSLKGTIADVTHPIVERIWAAGGVVHARTTTPEFSCAGFTHSRLWGITRNPWNLEYSPGGSSGGTAAALASGTATLGTGSDIGGSIRNPASFCGVVGYKPPYGRVPALPPFNLDGYGHDGPLARTVADTALLQNVISGPWSGDVVSLREKVTLTTGGSVRGMRVALCLTLGAFPVDPEVAANTLAVAEALRSAGATVEEVDLPWSRDDLMAAADAHYAGIFGARVAETARQHSELMTPYVLAFAAATGRARSFAEGLEIEGRLYAPLGALLDSHDALLCPTMPLPGFLAGDDYVDHGVTIDGVDLPSYFEAFMTIPFNIASRCPVLTIPSGLASTGVPTGVQLVGRTYDDQTVFTLGSAVERERPWSQRRPSF